MRQACLVKSYQSSSSERESLLPPRLPSSCHFQNAILKRPPTLKIDDAFCFDLNIPGLRTSKPKFLKNKKISLEKLPWICTNKSQKPKVIPLNKKSPPPPPVYVPQICQKTKVIHLRLRYTTLETGGCDPSVNRFLQVYLYFVGMTTKLFRPAQHRTKTFQFSCMAFVWLLLLICQRNFMQKIWKFS